MCGRYSLALVSSMEHFIPLILCAQASAPLKLQTSVIDAPPSQWPSQIRRMLEDDDMSVDDAPADEGEGAPRQSYNFAPGYHGIVYRADVGDRGAGPHQRDEHRAAPPNEDSHENPEEDDKNSNDDDDNNNTTKDNTTHYKLQSMKWGLIPFWTKRNPGYGSMLKTINCRDDSLATPGGMWASMKARKRCVVVAQGFYEWLRPGGPASKERVPYYVKRKDGKVMWLAGLWDCVSFEGEGNAEGGEKREGAEKLYTYTIITTSSNKQLRFLHDRMPVILEAGSEGMKTWLDPARYKWSSELQGLLKPFEGELECYPVSKEVGKVGNNSPSFLIPVDSKENKNNIANFFARGGGLKQEKGEEKEKVVEVEKGKDGVGKREMKNVDELKEEEEGKKDGGLGTPTRVGIKREASTGGLSPGKGEPPVKKLAFTTPSPAKTPVGGKDKMQTRGKISATKNAAKSPMKSKGKADGSQKITKFFGNSA